MRAAWDVLFKLLLKDGGGTRRNPELVLKEKESCNIQIFRRCLAAGEFSGRLRGAGRTQCSTFRAYPGSAPGGGLRRERGGVFIVGEAWSSRVRFAHFIPARNEGAHFPRDVFQLISFLIQTQQQQFYKAEYQRCVYQLVVEFICSLVAKNKSMNAALTWI